MTRRVPAWLPLAAALLFLVPAEGGAQGLANGPRLALASPALAPAAPTSLVGASDRLVMADGIRPNHWQEGGYVGAAVLGLLAGSFGAYACRDTDSGQDGNCFLKTVGGAAFGALVGFGVGAFIGGQFPKAETVEPEPDGQETR